MAKNPDTVGENPALVTLIALLTVALFSQAPPQVNTRLTLIRRRRPSSWQPHPYPQIQQQQLQPRRRRIRLCDAWLARRVRHTERGRPI